MTAASCSSSQNYDHRCERTSGYCKSRQMCSAAHRNMRFAVEWVDQVAGGDLGGCLFKACQWDRKLLRGRRSTHVLLSACLAHWAKAAGTPSRWISIHEAFHTTNR